MHVKIFILICAAVYCESSGCPAPELLKPCVCTDNAIVCSGKSNIDLVNIFQKLEKNLTKSEKHFKRFQLSNTFITELKENTFKDITFNEIIIGSCSNLTKIHINAFVETDLVTKKLIIRFNPKLSSPHNSIFEVLSKFVNLESLTLAYNNITKIPSNDFRSTVAYQDKLTHLSILGESIKSIGSNAFSTLNSLVDLTIGYTSIDYIPENAFKFNKISEKTLNLRIQGNGKLDSSGFLNNSLINMNRPVHLHISSSNKNIDYLDENVFSKFLTSNKHNQIDVGELLLDCRNCKNYWLKKQPNLLERVKNIHCSNKRNFNDTSNFLYCPYESLKPCRWFGTLGNQRIIHCGGNQDINLKAIFHNLSKQLSKNEKHFTMFILVQNNLIKVLEDNTFSDITFNIIEIESCNNLTKFERFAFNTTDLVTRGLRLKNNNKLRMDNTIYDIMSSFCEFTKN